MVDPVIPDNGFVIGRVYALDCPHIHPVFIWVGSSLVVRVNPARLTEVMLCCAGPKCINGQAIGAFDHLKIAQVYAYGGHSAAPTKRTIASARRVQSVGERDAQFDSAAMAGHSGQIGQAGGLSWLDGSPPRYFRRGTTGMLELEYWVSGWGG